MDRFDRIFDLHKLLSASRLPVPRQRIEQELECSRATAKRIIEAMRLYLNAPIKYDRQRNGYYYDPGEGEMFELPGVWFNASELFALLSVQQLLREVQPGLLERQLAPLKERIDQLLKAQHAGGDLDKRIRILRAASRPAGPAFQPIAGALAQGKRLVIDHYNRDRDGTIRREISPLRLVHYRDNWYLDAWCHLRNELRTFSLDAISSTKPTEKPTKNISDKALDDHFSSAYDIFSGSARKTAVLRFAPQRARWVAAEQWHPQQKSSWLEDDRYELSIPYSKTPELISDILKYGADVEVAAPPELRREVARQLQEALGKYK
ncbi:helix-turn-helix transcriptional regulator [Solemya velesiana gill symbiont]|uniref:Transcriptional regulator n=1 Tax=Solemya velesiana gill symbiont TaxID=1918948 RepID=A0A1T2KU70_9GAMM|nr:WYL domain-containing protein [Solemya velesiana gill symbiont]OOZ36403.1 transcriptional regulator [Solemya velesiana gill symbiont]